MEEPGGKSVKVCQTDTLPKMWNHIHMLAEPHPRVLQISDSGAATGKCLPELSNVASWCPVAFRDDMSRSSGRTDGIHWRSLSTRIAPYRSYSRWIANVRSLHLSSSKKKPKKNQNIGQLLKVDCLVALQLSQRCWVKRGTSQRSTGRVSQTNIRAHRSSQTWS